MTVELRGMEAVLKAMEKQLGERKMTRVVNKTLNDAGEEFKDGLIKAVSTYSNGSKESTGATAEEVVRGRSSKRGGSHSLKVGWSGPKNRYKLVHLNEFGYVRWGRRYNPRGMGVIRKYIDSAGRTYTLNVRKGLEGIVK